MTTQQRVVLAERPRYVTPTANCFQLETRPRPIPSGDEVLVRTLWLSLDPYLHSRIKRTTSQAEPVQVGDVMVGATVGRVEQSGSDRFAPGDLVYGFWGWQEYAAVTPKRLRKLPPELKQPSYALGALGLPGFGAYIALNKLAEAHAGETVLVGGATGSLGQVAGQLAKRKGCRVIGIAGSADKCRIAVERLGFDACVDRTRPKFGQALAEACPQGIDVSIETIGGDVFAESLKHLKLHARIAVCGLMANICDPLGSQGHLNATQLLNETVNRRLTIRGLVSFDYIRDHYRTFEQEMMALINDDAIVLLEEVIDGLANAGEAFQRLFEGKHTGKMVVRVGAD